MYKLVILSLTTKISLSEIKGKMYKLLILSLTTKISLSEIKGKMYKLVILSLTTKMYLTVLKSSKVSSDSLHCFFSVRATQHPDNP
jgi:hypothetical protein